MSSSVARTRFYGFDLVRLVSMMAIVVFHSNETAFFTDVSPIQEGSIYSWLQFLAKYIAFSGFTIVALSGFLYARHQPGTRIWLRLFALLGIGIFILAWLAGEGDTQPFIYEWDIYSYLFVSLVPLFCVRKSNFAIRVLALVGFLMLWIPFWNLVPVGPRDGPLWLHALIGVCTERGGGGWPLLPWAGLLWLFYGIGHEWIAGENFHRILEDRPKVLESILWILLLISGAIFWGGYAALPWGPGFECYVYRRPPYIFWTSFVWILFLMRMSLVKVVNDFLAGQAFVQWVSNLEWSRHFGRCYILHLIFLGVGSQFASVYTETPWLFDVYVLANMPVCEIVSRAVNRLSRKVRT